MSQLPSEALPPTNQSEAKPHQSHHPLPHQDMAEICEFQSKCLTGSSQELRERVKSREKVDYNVCPCHCDGVVMRWARPAQ